MTNQQHPITPPPIADAMTDPTARDLIQRLADSVELLLLMRNGLTPLVITEAALDEARAYLASPLPAATDCPRIDSWRPHATPRLHPLHGGDAPVPPAGPLRSIP